MNCLLNLQNCWNSNNVQFKQQQKKNAWFNRHPVYSIGFARCDAVTLYGWECMTILEWNANSKNTWTRSALRGHRAFLSYMHTFISAHRHTRTHQHRHRTRRSPFAFDWNSRHTIEPTEPYQTTLRDRFIQFFGWTFISFHNSSNKMDKMMGTTTITTTKHNTHTHTKDRTKNSSRSEQNGENGPHICACLLAMLQIQCLLKIALQSC